MFLACVQLGSVLITQFVVTTIASLCDFNVLLRYCVCIFINNTFLYSLSTLFYLHTHAVHEKFSNMENSFRVNENYCTLVSYSR